MQSQQATAMLVFDVEFFTEKLAQLNGLGLAGVSQFTTPLKDEQALLNLLCLRVLLEGLQLRFTVQPFELVTLKYVL